MKLVHHFMFSCMFLTMFSNVFILPQFPINRIGPRIPTNVIICETVKSYITKALGCVEVMMAGAQDVWVFKIQLGRM